MPKAGRAAVLGSGPMTTSPQRSAFSARLSSRRGTIMAAWEAKVVADPKLLTGNTLPRALLHDHLTALLEDFERRLLAQGAPAIESAEDDQIGDAAAHGLHRWQQGFDLAELVRELGRLNETVVAEIDRCATEPGLDERGLQADVHRIWASLYSVATSSSADQFFRLQQIESAGHLNDLEQALDALRTLESQRAALWQEAAHDLRGNLSVVSLVTAGLSAPAGNPEKTQKFVASLDRNVRGLHNILEDVTSLARLQGGQEVRSLSELDVSRLLHDLVRAMEDLGRERGLALDVAGAAPFPVQGDAAKLRRIVQNLVLNALRYTERGGVSVSWGADPQNETARWFVRVADTGPGLRSGPGSALAGALSVASGQARDVVEAEDAGEVVHVTPDESRPVMKPDGRVPMQASGEGLGLSIVKRLCTLLDATMEVDSVRDRGTIFTITLPMRYGA